jgi:tetratricopeptide (TPR) repeat protein
MRDLGVVSEVRPNLQASGETAHPLVIAAEWLLGEDPDQAIGLLASTHSQWMTMNVEPALSLHERTLQSSVVDNTARRLVEAQYLNLLWMAGRLGSHMDRAHRAFEWAVEAGENLTATRLAGALSYGWLSRGEFRQALSYAERAFAIASKSCDRLIQNEYEMHRGIIQGQLGMLGARQATITNYHRRVEEHPTPQEIASIGLQTFELRLAEGRPDLAASGLETSRRIFSSVAGSRMIAWVLQAEAVLHQSVGDLERARNSLEQIKAIGPEMAGHSVTAMCDDELACVDCRLGEYDSAAEALARASVYRKRMGTVQSGYERSRVRPARRVLQERLDSRDFRAAFSRAAASARPAAGR